MEPLHEPVRDASSTGPLGDADAVRLLAALAQQTRLRIFRLLVQAGDAGLTVGDVAHRLGVANATLSFHLKELSYAGLVTTRPEGRFVRCTADFERMNGLLGFLLHNCCGGADCAPTRTAPACTPAASR